MDNGPVTKADLKAAIDAAVHEIKEYVDVRTRELKEYVDARTRELKEYLDERTHDAETRLLRAFVDYSAGSDVRLRKLERETHTLDTTTTERLGELERRVTDLDVRVLTLEGRNQGRK
jgi:hypothetical protein